MAWLFDTDILIDYLRSRPDSVEVIEGYIFEADLSVMNVTELYQGVRDGDERTMLASTLSAFTVLPITLDNAEHGGLFARTYKASHSCGLADCLIAATAELHGLTLQTLNKKDYPMLKSVQVPYMK